MVDEFRLDPELHETVKGIRESVRLLFEELRLRNETGDVSGKKRLERIPALAKNNFSNLTGANRHLAAVEAWRLVAFIEGDKEAQMSPLAREALRVPELDKKLAALRSSNSWKAAAGRLREKLGVEPAETKGAEARRPQSEGTRDDTAVASPDSPSETGSRVGEAVSNSRHPLKRIGFSRPAAILGLAASAAIIAVAATWWLESSSDRGEACLAVEDASPRELARHRAPWSGIPSPRPPRTEARQQIITISDPPYGAPVRSTWITSQYSHLEKKGAPQRPGGGRSDYRLRVGGWGDTYLSLLRVPVQHDRLAHKAVVQLTVIGDEAISRPTSMTLRAIGERWNVGPEPDRGLWWRDCPQSEAMANHLPPPGPRGSVYKIDITDLYNMWAAGQRPDYGIMLEPEQIGSWGPGRPHYPNYSTFYSTRTRDPENRPRLVLTY